MHREENTMVIISTPESVFNMPKDGEAVCVTTNGIVKRSGHAVMGKGNALEANNLFHVSEKLGILLTRYGNHVYDLGLYKSPVAENGSIHVISFPTKDHWCNPSTLELIEQSAHELVKLCKERNIRKVYMPPPGCGCGGLSFPDVQLVLQRVFDDYIGTTFTIILN